MPTGLPDMRSCIPIDARGSLPSARHAYREGFMRHMLPILGTVAIILVAGCATHDAGQVLRHPTLDIQFRAPQGMEHHPWPGDPGVYEVIDSQSAVHVIVWHTTTEQDGLRYLMKMADMKGLSLDREPERRSIGGREAWVLDTTGASEGTPIHTLLAVLPHGKVPERPRENYLFIMQVWCPDSSWAQHRGTMQAILGSMEIME